MPQLQHQRLSHGQAPTPIEMAMMLLSLFSVIIVLTMTFGKLKPQTYHLLFFIDTFICAIFLSNFFIGFFRAKRKLRFIKEHWIDFVASIPAIEALRMARLFQILRVIRLIRMSRSILVPLLQQRGQTTLASLLVAMVIIITLASVSILVVESGHEGSNIQTAQQAIWWAIVTISTVGYGDYYPVTTSGHVIGTLVIICGVSFFGVISGYMASIFVAPDEKEQLKEHNQEIKNELEQALHRMEQNQAHILAELAQLREQVNQSKHQDQ